MKNNLRKQENTETILIINLYINIELRVLHQILGFYPSIPVARSRNKKQRGITESRLHII